MNDFLKFWYWGNTENIFLTGIPRNGGTPIRFNSIEDAMAAQTNIYIHANPVQNGFDGAKATEEDIAYLTGITIDIDPPHGFSPEQAREGFAAGLAKLNDFVKPTCVFETGRLSAVHFGFDKAWENDPANRERVKTLHRRLSILFSGDVGPDVAHLFKAPIQGTTALMNDEKTKAGWCDAPLGKVAYDGPRYALEALEAKVAHIPLDEGKPARTSEGWFCKLGTMLQDRCVADLLDRVDPRTADYNTWLRVGMALEEADDRFFVNWDEWSAQDEARYDEIETAYKWRSFKRSGVGFGTLVYMAQGWDFQKWVLDQREFILNLLGDGDEALHEEAIRLWMVLPTDKQQQFATKMKKLEKEVLTISNIKQTAKDYEKQFKEALLEDGESDEEESLTHDQIARKYIASLPGELKSVAGETWVTGPDNIWVPNTEDAMSEIAETFVSEARCSRNTDYNGIIASVLRRNRDQEFFAQAPNGIAHKSGFTHIKDGVLVREPLASHHRQTFALDYDPAPGEPTLLLDALREGMAGLPPEQIEGQLKLLKQFAGVSLVGLMPKEERALLMKGPEACGKSLFLKCLRELVPSQAVCQVSPADMGEAKRIGALAHCRLNILYEVEDDKSISGGPFKSIVAGEELQGWKLYVGAYTMRPTAATLMAGNLWPRTSDNSGGFWRRWAVILFTTTKPEAERDKTLLERIITTQGPQLLNWVLEGVQEYLANDRQLDLGPAHYKALADWKATRCSVAAFLKETDKVVRRTDQASVPMVKEHMYLTYQHWFATSDYKHIVGRNAFYERIEADHNGADGRYDGQRVYLGFTSGRGC